MGWFIISAVAGLISYLGIRLVQDQLSRSLVEASFPKTVKFFRRIGPGLLLLLGLALIVLLFVSVWWAPNFPYSATILNRLVVAAEGETTQFALGIIFGLLAGFTIENAGELIFPSVGTTGPDGEMPGAKAGHARHLWLGGSLMLLLFLGIFAPHIGGLVANLTRFKTALFEFEAKTNVASQRVYFREKRGELGFDSLGSAAAMSVIIERDIAYLRQVALKLVEAEIDEASKSETESSDYLDLQIIKLEEQKKQIKERIKRSSRAQAAIGLLLKPVLNCGWGAVSEAADRESVRDALRPPFNNLKLVMAASGSDTLPESLARRFVDSLKRARIELAEIVEDQSTCRSHTMYVRLHDEVAVLLEDKTSLSLVFSMINMFLKNFAAAKGGLRKLSVDDVGNYNGNWNLAQLLFYEGALAREYVLLLEDMRDRAKRETKELEKVLQLCDRDAACKDSEEHEGLKRMVPRYEIIRIITTNQIVFGIAVDVAEGRQIDDAEWRLALSGARELAAKTENEKAVVWERLDVRGAQDTVSFFRIVEELRKLKPDKKIVLAEVENLIQIEDTYKSALRIAKATDEDFIRAELRSVRNHIDLGRSILKQ